MGLDRENVRQLSLLLGEPVFRQVSASFITLNSPDRMGLAVYEFQSGHGINSESRLEMHAISVGEKLLVLTLRTATNSSLTTQTGQRVVRNIARAKISATAPGIRDPSLTRARKPENAIAQLSIESTLCPPV